jgi:uncharacterized membrane protein YoaK (UPF0700 family)
VTNNMVKFSDAFIGRYFGSKNPKDKRSALSEVLLPGLAWLTYGFAAAAGAIVTGLMSEPLIVPALLLILITIDLIRLPER